MFAHEKGGHAAIGLLYALFCSAMTNLGLGLFVLFINDLLPFGVSSPAQQGWGVALAINLGLILLWGVQHSVMARRRFKEIWTRLIPAHTERATYCLASAVALAAVCLFWAPLPGTLWSVASPVLAMGLGLLGAAGWLLLLAATFEIDHLELFGIRQALDHLRGREPRRQAFQTRAIYRFVRHPIQTGVLMGMWITPNMSVSRATLAAMMTVYILIGLYFEERDLVRQFGDRYRAYIRQVPKLIPLPRFVASRVSASTR